jgi:hypothetical protein
MVLVMVGGRTPSRDASWPGVWPFSWCSAIMIWSCPA